MLQFTTPRAFQRSLMCAAAARGDVEYVCRLLRDHGTDVLVADDDKPTPLIQAVQHGHVVVTKLLIMAGADVNAADGDNCTPLMHAAIHGHVAISKALINARANVNATDWAGVTPLMQAAVHGRTAVIKVLLATRRARVHAKGSGGCTARSLASNRACHRLLCRASVRKCVLPSRRCSHSPPRSMWPLYAA